jgi:hypothetical protein
MSRRSMVWDRLKAEQSAPVQTAQQAPVAPTAASNDIRACGKCGKVFTRGLFVHQKFCKG